MNYRETGDDVSYEEPIRDIVLRRPSVLGPWLVRGLGVTLACFLSYLVYANVLTPTVPSPSPERSLRLLTKSAPSVTLLPLKRVRPRLSFLWGPAITSVPQSRVANALLGGDGPASFPGSIAVTAYQSFDQPPETTPVSH